MIFFDFSLQTIKVDDKVSYLIWPNYNKSKSWVKRFNNNKKLKRRSRDLKIQMNLIRKNSKISMISQSSKRRKMVNNFGASLKTKGSLSVLLRATRW